MAGGSVGVAAGEAKPGRRGSGMRKKGATAGGGADGGAIAVLPSYSIDGIGADCSCCCCCCTGGGAGAAMGTALAAAALAAAEAAAAADSAMECAGTTAGQPRECRDLLHCDDRHLRGGGDSGSRSSRKRGRGCRSRGGGSSSLQLGQRGQLRAHGLGVGRHAAGGLAGRQLLRRQRRLQLLQSQTPAVVTPGPVSGSSVLHVADAKAPGRSRQLAHQAAAVGSSCWQINLVI